MEVRPDPTGRADVREAADPELIDTYPFTAIVEQERLTTALLLNAVNPAIGGVLVSGPSGTGKSTAVRGLAALLPEIDVVADCPFSCDPTRLCVLCADRRESGAELPVVSRRVRIVTLPLNATEDRVAGSVDIARALREGIAALQPGLVAEANRGILYVDEINLLDDHLCDVLLDAAALGVNVVEREGVSITHPARFLLIGTMNPEEGELRPQIADRIGLHVVADAIADTTARVEVLRRREAFGLDPTGFVQDRAEQESSLARRIDAARGTVAVTSVGEAIYGAIAQLVVRSGVVSHRADVTILECAKALAAFGGRSEVEAADVLDAARLSLGHRVPTDPFDANAGIDDRLLRRILDEVLEADTQEAETRKKAAGPAGPG